MATPNNPLRQLHDLGQSVWLDYIRRDLITGGGLQRLIEEDGLCGVTSNPTIFDKAIAENTFYDDSLRRLLLRNQRTPAGELFEKLEVENIQAAADVFRPVYEESEGRDGFVSIVPAPVITLALLRRLRSREDEPFADKLLAMMRHGFGGHEVKKE